MQSPSLSSVVLQTPFVLAFTAFLDLLTFSIRVKKIWCEKDMRGNEYWLWPQLEWSHRPAFTQAQLSCISVWHSPVSPLLSNTGSNWLQGSGRGITLPFFGPTYYYIWARLLWCRALVPQVMFEALKWALLLWHRIGWAKFGYSGV